MLYSKYQEKTLYYIYCKYKFGIKTKEKNDLEKNNLKGSVLKCESNIIDNKGNVKNHFLLFFDNGQLLQEHNDFLDVRETIYNYYDNEVLSTIEEFDLENKLISTVYFKYNDRWKLIQKKHLLSKGISYTENIDYDSRGNIISSDCLYDDLKDYITTYVYDYYGRLTHRYSYEMRNLLRFRKYKYSKKLDINIVEIIDYTSEDNELGRLVEFYNSNKDIVKKSSIYLFGSFEATYVYKYDKNDNWIEKFEYIGGVLKESTKRNITYFECR